MSNTNRHASRRASGQIASHPLLVSCNAEPSRVPAKLCSTRLDECRNTCQFTTDDQLMNLSGSVGDGLHSSVSEVLFGPAFLRQTHPAMDLNPLRRHRHRHFGG